MVEVNSKPWHPSLLLVASLTDWHVLTQRLICSHIHHQSRYDVWPQWFLILNLLILSYINQSLTKSFSKSLVVLVTPTLDPTIHTSLLTTQRSWSSLVNSLTIKAINLKVLMAKFISQRMSSSMRSYFSIFFCFPPSTRLPLYRNQCLFHHSFLPPSTIPTPSLGPSKSLFSSTIPSIETLPITNNVS